MTKAPTPHPRRHSSGEAARFAATRWTIVLAASERPDGSRSRQALEQLAQAYWFPLYAFIRRQGYEVAQAEDLTQTFFARLIEKRSLASVDRAKGKFRSFLLASVQNFLANERDKSQALKRGAGRVISLDALDAEARYAAEPADEMTPERIFERRWAWAVLDLVLDRLRQKYTANGQETLFDALKGTLTGQGDAPAYEALASKLNMTTQGVAVAVHRLRRAYRQTLRHEIAQTVATPELVEEEIVYLLGRL